MVGMDDPGYLDHQPEGILHKGGRKQGVVRLRRQELYGVGSEQGHVPDIALEILHSPGAVGIVLIPKSQLMAPQRIFRCHAHTVQLLRAQDSPVFGRDSAENPGAAVEFAPLVLPQDNQPPAAFPARDSDAEALLSRLRDIAEQLQKVLSISRRISFIIKFYGVRLGGYGVAAKVHAAPSRKLLTEDIHGLFLKDSHIRCFRNNSSRQIKHNLTFLCLTYAGIL